MGGDYYDLLELKKGHYGLIVGDVSGKGTSAAFHMAQMKGIFHSLAAQDVRPGEFIKRANRALSACLEKHSFITASYFWIDTNKSQIEFSRAGHVPALYYENVKHEVTLLEERGMGLGILRNSNYDKFVQNKTLSYHPDDILVLYTDGIMEAKNNKNEQFGIERLKTLLAKHKEKNPTEIKEVIIQELMNFLNGIKLDDDYTLLVVKFN